MMRSMYSAVSSLRAHQTKMDVIGNNIANVNTVGFKGSRVTFEEVFSQTIRGAGRPQEGGRGGTNPQQIGLGIDVSSMDTFHTRGSVERTDNNTDLMINGDGLFIVSDTAEGTNRSYTRAGNFIVDTNGNLVTASGYHVLGYQADENGKLVEELTGLKISKAETISPQATDTAIFSGNINSDLPAEQAAQGNVGDDDYVPPVEAGTFDTTMKAYDSLGNAHNIKMQFTRSDDGTGTGREFTATILEPDSDSNDFEAKLTFNQKGELIGIDGENPNDVEIKLGVSSDILDGAEDLDIELDFKSLTSYSSDSNAAVLKINGYESGKLDDFSMSPTGEIEAVFSNGEMRIIGQVRLANFNNPAGLQKTGSNMYRQTSNSGEAMFGYAGMGGFGEINSGSLEMSNVDLSREFTDMITTQRGFQANSRVITTSDEMLQELVNLKR